MTTRRLVKVLRIQGGYATDLAPETNDLSHLSLAQNVSFQVSGSARKFGGSQRLNPVAIPGSPDVVGMFDFWLNGLAGTPSQQFLMVGGDGKFYRHTGSVPLDITGSVTWTTGARPVFCQFSDTLTVWSSAGDAPVKWQQDATMTALGGSPPFARIAIAHQGRIWAANTNQNPSRLFYGGYGAANVWSGADTGFFDIDVEDGDKIIGLASFADHLIVFKGPVKGSIHRVGGTAPTGADAFFRKPIVSGIPLQSHQSIVPVIKDLWFMSDRGIHSLQATDETGNFAPSDLSRTLTEFFISGINRTRQEFVWGVHYPHRSCVVWTMTLSGSSENNLVLIASYIRQPEEGLKWSTLYPRAGLSACIRIDPTTEKRELVFGTTNGFAERQDINKRGLASSSTGGFILNVDRLNVGRLGDAFASAGAYAFRVMTPQIRLTDVDARGQPRGDSPVTLSRVYVKSEPLGAHNLNMSLTRDDNGPEFYAFNQGSSGFVLDVDRLDVGKLGGGRLQTVYADVAGEARSISLDMTVGGTGEDVNVYEVGIEYDMMAPVSSTDL